MTSGEPPEGHVPGPTSPQTLLDLALGAGALTAEQVSLWAGRLNRLLQPVAGVVARPPLVARQFQPAKVARELSLRGAGEREVLLARLDALLDVVLPRITAQVLSRVDMTALVVLVEQVLDVIDLPDIIRESTGSMASETVREVRMQGIAADEAVARVMDRLLLRRSRIEAEPADRTRVNGGAPDAG